MPICKSSTTTNLKITTNWFQLHPDKRHDSNLKVIWSLSRGFSMIRKVVFVKCIHITCGRLLCGSAGVHGRYFRRAKSAALPHKSCLVLDILRDASDYFCGGVRCWERVELESRFERPDGRLKNDWGNFGWNVLENTLDKLGKLDGANADEPDGENDDEVGNDSDCLGNLTGLCSVPYQIICHLWRSPLPGLGVLSGPMFITSKLQVPTADSPKKWTDRKGHSSNLDPKVSLGRGKRSVEREPDGEVITSIILPLGM